MHRRVPARRSTERPLDCTPAAGRIPAGARLRLQLFLLFPPLRFLSHSMEDLTTYLTGPCRVVIYARPSDIEGDPLGRPVTLGQDFCVQVAKRDLHDLRHEINSNNYDAAFFPPGFDSDTPRGIYFLFDLGVTGPLGQDELATIPHLSFYATRHNGVW